SLSTEGRGGFPDESSGKSVIGNDLIRRSIWVGCGNIAVDHKTLTRIIQIEGRHIHKARLKTAGGGQLPSSCCGVKSDLSGSRYGDLEISKNIGIKSDLKGIASGNGYGTDDDVGTDSIGSAGDCVHTG